MNAETEKAMTRARAGEMPIDWAATSLPRTALNVRPVVRQPEQGDGDRHDDEHDEGEREERLVVVEVPAARAPGGARAASPPRRSPTRRPRRT